MVTPIGESQADHRNAGQKWTVIKEYVDKECMNYWSISQNPEGNMIAYSSWKFYNSKDLDNFIHKTLRKNISNYER